MTSYKKPEKPREPGSPEQKRAKLLYSVNDKIDSYCSTGRDIHGLISGTEMRLIEKKPKYKIPNQKFTHTFVRRKLSMNHLNKNKE